MLAHGVDSQLSDYQRHLLKMCPPCGTDLSYIASGGVGDGKQLAAALALGAQGVNMGTRFCR